MEKRYVVAICESNWKGEGLDIFIKSESELKSFVYNSMSCHYVLDEKFENEDELEQFWDRVCDDVITDHVKEYEVLCSEAIITIKKID